MLDRLPEDWLDERAAARASKPRKRRCLPQCSCGPTDGWVEPTTTVVAGVVGAGAVPLLPCAAASPTPGAAAATSAKLTTLGSEGRCTATTIMSLAAIARPARRRRPAGRGQEAAVVHRQPPGRVAAGRALQRLRPGRRCCAPRCTRAVADGRDDGLTHDEVAAAGLRRARPAVRRLRREPELEVAARTDTERVLREVLGYRLYRDLRARLAGHLPNLEQTGLLEIDYESLDELAADERRLGRTCHAALADGHAASAREFVLGVLLDDAAPRAGDQGRRPRPRLPGAAASSASNQRLDGAVGDRRRATLEYAAERAARGRGKRDDRRVRSTVSARGGVRPVPAPRRTFARLRRTAHARRHRPRSSSELFDALRRYGPRRAGRRRRATATPGYQLPASAMRWTAGDGTRPYHDPIRMPTARPRRRRRPTSSSSTSTAASATTCSALEAREHTAQVPYDERDGARGAVPQRRPAGALLLADDGARRRHRRAQRRQHAQRAADAGQLRPALGPGRPQRPAGAGVHLLLGRQPPRPVLLPPARADGRRPGRRAPARPRQRGPRPRPRARRLAGRERPRPRHAR